MGLDPKAFADMIVMTVERAMAPVLERLAAQGVEVKQALGVEAAVTGLRERVVVLETKAAAPDAAPEPPDVVSPVLERLAATEARMARLAALELTVGELRDKLISLETKAALPHDPPAVGPTAADIELSIRDAVAPLRERVAVLEVRPLLPGPPGPPGLDGKDGVPGLNGKDGLAGLSYEGVYQEGKSYELGHLVTWGGSAWHCNEPTTTKPGDGSKAWTLMVKRGRDGHDGKDAETVPVVSLGRR